MIKSNCGLESAVTDDTLLLRLTGEMDHHSAAGLRGEADRLICAERPRRVVLELSGIGFMDSSGLGFIMGRYSLARELGATLTVRDPSPATQRILDLAGLRRIVPVEKSRSGTHERGKHEK